MSTSQSRGGTIVATTGTTWASTGSAVDGAVGTNPATYATWTSSTNGGTGTITIGSYIFGGVDAGATISGVTAAIRHLENSTTRITAVSVQLQDSSGANIGSAASGTVSTSAHTDTLTVGTPTAAQVQAGLRVKVTATHGANTQSGIFSLDQVDLTVTYTPSSFTGPNFGSAGTNPTSANSTTIAVPVPPNVANNDIIIVPLIQEGASVTVTATGFAEAPNSPVAVTGSQANVLHILWKRASAADTGTYTFTLSSSAFVEAFAVRFTGANTSGSPWDTVTSSNNAINSGTSVASTPAVSDTTTGPNRLQIWCAGAWGSGTSIDPTPPTGFTIGSTWTVENEDALALAFEAQAAAGSTGSLSGSFSTATGAATAWVGALLPTSNSYSDGANTAATASLTAGGTLTISNSANTAATASVTANGFVGRFDGANTSATASLTANGGKQVTDGASTTVTASPTANGVRTALDGASRTTTAGLTANGSVGRSDGASLTITATPTANGFLGVSRGVNNTTAATITADGVRTALDGTSTAVTAGLTANGILGVSRGVSTTATAALTADGAVNGTSNGSADRVFTATLTANGVLSIHDGTNTVATANLTANGVRGAFAGADTSVTAVLTANGAPNFAMGANASTTAQLTANGIVSVSRGASTVATATLTADGIIAGSLSDGTNTIATASASANGYISTSAGTTTVVTAHVTADGIRAVHADASIAVSAVLAVNGILKAMDETSLPVNVSLTADGVVAFSEAANLMVTAALIADGHVNTAVIDIPAANKVAISPEARTVSLNGNYSVTLSPEIRSWAFKPEVRAEVPLNTGKR